MNKIDPQKYASEYEARTGGWFTWCSVREFQTEQEVEAYFKACGLGDEYSGEYGEFIGSFVPLCEGGDETDESPEGMLEELGQRSVVAIIGNPPRVYVHNASDEDEPYILYRDEKNRLFMSEHYFC